MKDEIIISVATWRRRLKKASVRGSELSLLRALNSRLRYAVVPVDEPNEGSSIHLYSTW